MLFRAGGREGAGHGKDGNGLAAGGFGHLNGIGPHGAGAAGLVVVFVQGTVRNTVADLDAHGSPFLYDVESSIIRPKEGGARDQPFSLTRYTRVAVLARPRTLTVTLPRSRRDNPLRPWLRMKMRSQPSSSAACTIPTATCKL